MKKLVTILALLMMYEITVAQPVSRRQAGVLVNVIPYHIEVSDLSTTILLFPFEVKDADMGVRQLLATKIPDMKNILKLKAESPLLENTSLYVVTSDGTVHAFEVNYIASSHPRLYELSLDRSLNLLPASPVLFQEQPFSAADLQKWVSRIRSDTGSMHHTSRGEQLTVVLKEVYSVNSFMFFKFELSNHSTLPYTPSWLQLYVKDRKKPKRSAVQEITIDPIYTDTLQELAGRSTSELVIGIKRQTLPRSRKMIFELHEDNGGRNLQFVIKNRYLLRAKNIH